MKILICDKLDKITIEELQKLGTCIDVSQDKDKSKKIKEALLKRGRLARKIAVCEHDKIDYKTMNLLAKKSIAVIENLAKAVASLEERNKVSEESLIGFLNTAQKMISDFGASEELTDENINWYALNGNQDVAKFLDEVTTGNGEFSVDFPKHSKSWNDIQSMESGFLKFRKNKAKKQEKAKFANQNTMPEFVMNDGTRVTQAELQQAQTLFKATKEQRADFDDDVNDLYDNLFKEMKDMSADKGYTYGMTRKDQFAQLQKRSLEESENIINSIGGSYGYIYANMMKGSDGKVNGSMGRYLSDTPTDEEKAAVQAFVQEKILNKLPNSLRPEQNLEDQDDAKDWKQFGLGSCLLYTSDAADE